MEPKQIADIPESYFQYRGDLVKPLFDGWFPNKLMTSIVPALKKWDVGLADVSWAPQATNLRDLQITFSVPKVNSAIRLGLDSITFDVANPDWTDAPIMMELLGTFVEALRSNLEFALAKQEVAVAMHVRSSDPQMDEVMKGLVNESKLGPAEMYGVSVYRGDSACIIDKSLRYPSSYFIRLTRTFEASIGFSEVALSIYNDEVAALGLLGLTDFMRH